MNLNTEELLFLEIKNEKPTEIHLLDKEASNRIYYRVKYSEKEFILCKDKTFTDDLHSFLQVQSFLEQNRILVPRIIKTNPKLNLILQEDAGKFDLSSIIDDETFAIEVKKSIDIIYSLQSLQPIELIKKKSFDKDKNLFELNYTLDAFKKFAEFYEINVQIQHELYAFLEEASIFLANYENKVICHRDFHVRNILLNENSEQVIIDFQDMMMGSNFYDLASILFDAYKPIDSIQREKLYTYFLDKFEKKIPRAREYFLTQCLQRSFKALGTYLFQFHQNKNYRFKVSIQKCLTHLLEISQLGMFSDQCYVFFFLFKKELEENEKFNLQ